MKDNSTASGSAKESSMTAAREREAVVRLLRKIAGPLPKGVLNGEVWILHRVADAIEAGTHIMEKSDGETALSSAIGEDG